jgi:Right handed beta helix region
MARRWYAAGTVVLAVLAAACSPQAPTDDDRSVGGQEPVTVRLEVGDAFQERVDQHPPGTTYVVAAGVHRLQQVVPHSGDRFIGESGAILSGARVLTDFLQDDGLWVAEGQTQEGMAHGEMEPGRERDAHPEDLFIDGQRLRHVADRDEVGPGAWFFDYEADRIYLGDDPSGRLVETSVTEWAIGGEGVEDVTIENLTFRQYANRAQTGAIHGQGTRGWTVGHVDASFNHGTGIRVGPGWDVSSCRATYNGQMGISGSGEYVEGDPIRVTGCEIAHNKQLGYNWEWEGGATKFANTSGMVFENNWVHGNIGAGPWFDIDNRDAVIRSNLVEGNTHVGILYEISYGAEIHWNEVRDNGGQAGGDLGAGILISNSSDVEVFENLLSGNRHGILVVQADRGDGEFGRYEVTGLSVRDNDIAVDAGAPGLRVTTGEDDLYSSEAVRFMDNTYRLDDPDDDDSFYWGEGLDAEGWQAQGLDVDGQFLDQSEEGTLPADVIAFKRQEYGPR